MLIFCLLFGLPVFGVAESAGALNEELAREYRGQADSVRNLGLKAFWAEDGESFVFREELGGGDFRFWKVDCGTGERVAGFDHDVVRAALKEKGLGFGLVDVSDVDGGLRFRVGRDKRFWRWDGKVLGREKRSVREEKKRKEHGWNVSPDGKWRVEFREFNAVLVEVGKGERALTSDGVAEHYYEGVRWSPDSSRVAVWRVKSGQRRMVTVVENTPKDQVQPKVHSWRYDKPGDVIDTRAPWVFFVDGREGLGPDLGLIEHPFSVSKLEWRDDSRRLTYEYVERGFGKYFVMEADTEKLVHRVLVREESETFIFVSGNGYRYDLDGGEEILWASERDGWNHLYLLDGRTGEVKNRVTKGDYFVDKVVRVDEEKRRILFVGLGMTAGKDPYFRKLYWVNFDGSGLVALTPGDGTHEVDFSPSGEYYLDVWSRVDLAPIYELRRSVDGSLIREIFRVDMEALKGTGWVAPKVMSFKDRDGEFDVWGTVLLPKDFDAAKKYPVVELIYAGPHGQFVGKNFRVWRGAASDFAARGFIVVRIDGKGTGKRCRKFSHFSYKNLVDSGLPDRIKWMREAAKVIPQMDLERVGIFGGSAGGQSSTAAVLHHGDFYKVAVSDCGCHDNRMDKIWWNEQWMDWPVGPHYAEQSNVTNAGKLTGKLLLTVGELDRNVDPASTMQVAAALTRAGKDFELLVVPGADHGAGEGLYGKWRRMVFFERWLGGAE